MKEIILDTKPLLIYLYGLYHSKTLKKYNCTSDEFYVFLEFMKQFSVVWVTPYVLAEISNLANKQLGDKSFSDFINDSKKLLSSFGEIHTPKNLLLEMDNVPKFGMTDASLIEAAGKNKTLLTSDGPLFYFCRNKQFPSIHLDQVFSFRYDSSSFNI